MTSLRTLSDRIANEGYEGDPLISDLLKTATELEADRDALQKKVTELQQRPPVTRSSPLVIAVLGSLAAIGITSAIYLGLQSSTDAQRIATLSTQNATVMKQNAEAAVALKGLSEQLAAALSAAGTTVTEAAKAANNAAAVQRDTAKLYQQMIDAQKATAENAAKSAAPGNTTPPQR